MRIEKPICFKCGKRMSMTDYFPINLSYKKIIVSNWRCDCGNTTQVENEYPNEDYFVEVKI